MRCNGICNSRFVATVMCLHLQWRSVLDREVCVIAEIHWTHRHFILFPHWYCTHNCISLIFSESWVQNVDTWIHDCVSLQKSPTMVRFPPKAKVKKTVVDIWRYMTVADVANAMGKSVGKYCYILFLFMQLCPFSPFFKSLELKLFSDLRFLRQYCRAVF